MDLRKIRKLIEIFNVSNLSEIEIHEGEESIRLTRSLTVVADAAQQTVVQQTSPDSAQALSGIEIDDAQTELEGTFPILSPMVGTFFTAPSPTDDPFVRVGDQVSAGQPLCLIEAMKIFNQIEAERDGTVIRILKGDGDPVEFGEPLFVLSE